MAAGFWMLAAACAAALAVWLTTAWLLDVADGAPAADKAKIRVDAVRTGLAAGAGAGAAVGLMLAFRRQRHAELATALDELDAAERRRDAAERRITELYNAAAEQLGSDKAPVRLTALYTLERLANDNPRHQQTIVNIICAYLRMPYTPPPADRPGPEEEHRERTRRNAARYRAARDNRPIPAAPLPHGPDPHEEHQVRLTAQRLLQTHLHPTAEHHWADIDLDLTGATLTDFFLIGCTIHHVDFTNTTFSGDAVFGGATFTRYAIFRGATFSGDAVFGGATFPGSAVFTEATFSGDAVFLEATFTGHAVFFWASFSGDAEFDAVSISGDARFSWATFSGLADFGGAIFSGHAEFEDVRFEAVVELESATVADAARVHVPPPGWKIETVEGGTGRFVPAPSPGSG
ncbi:pentapeptide repeat-containing protein [Actinomadura sp. WMMA1423]|uniref:pentapeptide repeat-containing protein n=1 Tax=Actinomadura sp. WMMA1423 TaxID=2591108 RepID=UPI00197AD93E|nr:pentapeptide repeat-containing protein [Actinomadura sp. WMMA1423]